PDRALFVREGVLYAQRIDVAAARMIGDSITVASPFQVNATAYPRISASHTGVIVFRTDPEVRSQIQWVDRSGKPIEGIGPPLADVSDASLSPDKRTLAVVRRQQNDQLIWLMDVARGTLSRFTSGNRPLWSPDGTRLTFTSSRDGFARIYTQAIGTNDAPELL